MKDVCTVSLNKTSTLETPLRSSRRNATRMAPIVSFVLLLLSYLASRILSLWSRSKRKLSPAEQQLASEIKELLRQANSLTTPATFAKAAKLKRLAVAKERELLQLRHTHGNGQNRHFLCHLFGPNSLQILTYLILVHWYWENPLLSVPSRTIYPFDSTILGSNFSLEDKATLEIGILPWLVVCSRVCAFLARKAIP